MVERIDEMPAGTIGFRVVAKLTGDDYREQIEPAIGAAAEAGEVRLLFEIDSGFGMDAGAVIEDAKTGLKSGLGHMKAWKRTAVVTDVDWIGKAIRRSASWRRGRCGCSSPPSSAPPRSGSPSSAALSDFTVLWHGQLTRRARL
jgi:hypothetical protein